MGVMFVFEFVPVFMFGAIWVLVPCPCPCFVWLWFGLFVCAFVFGIPSKCCLCWFEQSYCGFGFGRLDAETIVFLRLLRIRPTTWSHTTRTMIFCALHRNMAYIMSSRCQPYDIFFRVVASCVAACIDLAKTLNLSTNKIGDIGAERLAEALPHLTNLKVAWLGSPSLLLVGQHRSTMRSVHMVLVIWWLRWYVFEATWRTSLEKTMCHTIFGLDLDAIRSLWCLVKSRGSQIGWPPHCIL